MLAVKGIYDGKKVEILDKVNMPEGKLQEVIVTFLNEEVHIEPLTPMLGISLRSTCINL